MFDLLPLCGCGSAYPYGMSKVNRKYSVLSEKRPRMRCFSISIDTMPVSVLFTILPLLVGGLVVISSHRSEAQRIRNCSATLANVRELNVRKSQHVLKYGREHGYGQTAGFDLLNGLKPLTVIFPAIRANFRSS